MSPGAPPLQPFGLVLHHDGRWSHGGQPIRNRRLREHFDRSVRFLPGDGKYVVTLRHFRGEIDVEEAGFFVRGVDAESGTVRLSDGSEEALDPASLRLSQLDGALLCTIKRALTPAGLPARFTHAAQSELLQLALETPDGPAVRLAGSVQRLPDL
jgi:hypothetical protein